MALPLGVAGVLLGLWLTRLWLLARGRTDSTPVIVHESSRPQPQAVRVPDKQHTGRTVRSKKQPWLGRIVELGLVVLYLLGLWVYGPPKDEHSRPMKWERGRWVEAPAPVEKPSGSELINIRDMLEASKRSPSEPKEPPITTTEPNTSPGASTQGEHTAKFWRDTVVKLPEALQSKQSDDAPSWLRNADLSWMRSRFDDRDRVDDELVDLVARALVNVEDYREAADEEPHKPSSENNEAQPPPSSRPNGAIFPDLPAPERIEWWRAVRKLARSEESRIAKSLLASLDNYNCPPLAGVTASGEEQQKSLERLRINFYQIEQLREKLEERYPDQQFTLPWRSRSQDSD